MLLTKKRLHRIKKSKYQSRKKYQKGGKKKKRKRKRSFRKRRKALNLRKKSLRKYKQRGGTRDELIMLVPAINPAHPTKISALMFIKTKEPIIKKRMISAFIHGEDVEFRKFVYRMLDGNIFKNSMNMGLQGGKYIRLPDDQYLNSENEKDIEYLVKLNLVLLGIQKKNPQLSSNEIQNRIAVLASKPVVSKKVDSQIKNKNNMAKAVNVAKAASKFKSGLKHDMFKDDSDNDDGDILLGDRCAVSKLMNPDGTAKDFPCYPLQKMRDAALEGQLKSSRNPDCLGVAKQLSDKQASCKYDESGKLVQEEEEYEDDFEDPCEGVKCELGEKCVDGDCKNDDYSDDTFKPDNTVIGQDLPSVPGSKKITEPVDIMCANDNECKKINPEKPKCFNGTCVKEAWNDSGNNKSDGQANFESDDTIVQPFTEPECAAHSDCPSDKPKCLNDTCVTQEDFTTAKKAEGATVRNLRETSSSSNEGEDDIDLSGFFDENDNKLDGEKKGDSVSKSSVTGTIDPNESKKDIDYSDLESEISIAIINLMMNSEDDDVSESITILQNALDAIKNPAYPNRNAVITRGQELLVTLGPQSITIPGSVYGPETNISVVPGNMDDYNSGEKKEVKIHSDDGVENVTTDPLQLNPGDVLQVAIYNGPRWDPNNPEKYDNLWRTVDLIRNNEFEEKKILSPETNVTPRYEWKDIHKSIIGFPIRRDKFLSYYQPASPLLYTLVNVKFVRFENGKYYVEPINVDEIKFPRTFGDPDKINTRFFTEVGGPKETLRYNEILKVNGEALTDNALPDGQKGNTKVSDTDNFPTVPDSIPTRDDGTGDIPTKDDSVRDIPTRDDVNPNPLPGTKGTSNIGFLPNPSNPQVVPNTTPSAPPLIPGGNFGPGEAIPGTNPVNPNFIGSETGNVGRTGSMVSNKQRSGVPGRDSEVPIIGKNDPIRYHQPWVEVRGQVFPGPYQPGFRVVADTGVNFTSWLRHLGQPNPTPSGPSSFSINRDGSGGDRGDTKVNTFSEKQSFKSEGDTKVMAEPLPEAVAEEIPSEENPVIQISQSQKTENPDQPSVDSINTERQDMTSENSDTKKQENTNDTSKAVEEKDQTTDEWGSLPEGVGIDIPDRNEPVWKKIIGDQVPVGSEVVMGLQTGEKYIRKPPTSEEKQSQEDLDMKQGVNADLSEEAKKGAADSAEEAAKKLQETMKQIEEIANCKAKSMAIEQSMCPTKRSDYLKMLRNLAVDKAYNSACKDHAGRKLEYFRETCKKPALSPSSSETDDSKASEKKVPVSSNEGKTTTDSKRGGTRKNKSSRRKKKSKRRNLKKSTKRRR